MGVPLQKHYPSDDVYRDDAVARVAANLVKEDEVVALVDEIDAASAEILARLTGHPSFDAVTFMQRVRQIMRSIQDATDELRAEEDASLTP